MNVEDFLELLEGVKPTGPNQWTAKCPAADHDDRNASLTVGVGKDGQILVHCFTACALEDITAGVGVEVSDLFSENGNQPPRRRGDDAHRLALLPGDEGFQRWSAALLADKSMLRAFFVAKGWSRGLLASLGLGLKGNRLVIPVRDLDGELVTVVYYGPGLDPKLQAAKGRPRTPLFLVNDDDLQLWTEGEPDAITGAQMGFSSVGIPGVGKLPKAEWLESARGHRVALSLDNDDAGRRAEKVWAPALAEVARELVIVHSPVGKDIGDLLREHRHNPNRARRILLELIEAAEPWQPEEVEAQAEVRYDVTHEPRERPRVAVQENWPAPLRDAAYHGLVGRAVSMIEPHSEADPAAVLVQLLVAFGNAAGRSAAFHVEGDRHGAALYVGIIAATAKGRKGTSWGRVRQLFDVAERSWREDRVTGGLSSGEGLVWHVRDPVTKQVPVKGKDKQPTGEFVEETEDPGVTDKRMLVVEGELAAGLRIMRREGNTLSAVVRRLWDDGTAGALTKTNHTTTHGAHVSIVGHITRDELRRELTDTEAANGFANRFLWVCARRCRVLPFGGQPDEGDVQELGRDLHDALDFAHDVGRVRFTQDAAQRWASIYEELSEGQEGLLGAVTARAEAQVIRLAVIYALIDSTDTIDLPHLEAALAVWEYADASARYIFGEALGDPMADEILGALRRSGDGMTRTQLSNLFSRHASRNRMEQALGVLRNAGLVTVETEQTGGRPAERWRYSESSVRSAQSGQGGAEVKKEWTAFKEDEE